MQVIVRRRQPWYYEKTQFSGLIGGEKWVQMMETLA